MVDIFHSYDCSLFLGPKPYCVLCIYTVCISKPIHFSPLSPVHQHTQHQLLCFQHCSPIGTYHYQNIGWISLLDLKLERGREKHTKKRERERDLVPFPNAAPCFSQCGARRRGRPYMHFTHTIVGLFCLFCIKYKKKELLHTLPIYI